MGGGAYVLSLVVPIMKQHTGKLLPHNISSSHLWYSEEELCSLEVLRQPYVIYKLQYSRFQTSLPHTVGLTVCILHPPTEVTHCGLFGEHRQKHIKHSRVH